MLGKHGLIATGAALLALALPVIARAEVLTWVMEGTVQNVVESPVGWSPLGQEGDRVSYSITFDSETLPQHQSFQAISASAHIGSQLLSVSNPMFGFLAQPPEAFVAIGQVAIGNITGSVDFELHHYLAGVLDSNHLPPQPYSLSDFESATFNIGLYGVYPQQKWLSGTIDAFYAIPEPSSLLLGLAMFTCASRRRRQLRVSR
jgi:hypothetical protein